jgi:hypothetical protein
MYNMPRKSLPTQLNSEQIDKLRVFLLDTRFNFRDESTNRQFMDLMESYTDNKCTTLDRIRLRELINELPSTDFDYVNKILGKDIPSSQHVAEQPPPSPSPKLVRMQRKMTLFEEEPISSSTDKKDSTAPAQAKQENKADQPSGFFKIFRWH